jgi:micrococcal nuclease
MDRRTAIWVVLVLVVAATGPALAADPDPDGPDGNWPAGDDCTIDTDDLQKAIQEWATGGITTSRLQGIIQFWATGERVSGCQPDGPVVEVSEVVDGDTLEIQYENGTSDTVRLVGIDTPEVYVETDPQEFEGIPDTRAGHDWLRGWGENASAYTERVVGNASVRLSFDNQSDRRGTYGRLLAYVHVNDSFVLNAALVERGYARVYTAENFEQESQYLAAEATAQQQDTGLWAFETPGDSSGTDAEGLVVASIHEDAAGNDNNNPNDEYIVFENSGDTALELSGWQVADTAGHTYTFPSGFTLEPGDTVKLYTGSGTDTGSKLYWGSESAIWNNGGDTIIVTTEAGEEVLRREYS